MSILSQYVSAIVGRLQEVFSQIFDILKHTENHRGSALLVFGGLNFVITIRECRKQGRDRIVRPGFRDFTEVHRDS